MQKRQVTFSSKKTNIYIKRDLYLCQKRPTTTSKETCIYVKSQKESHIYVKRDLHLYQKCDIYIYIYTYIKVSAAIDMGLFG